ncbi:hypothetical protein JCM9140_2311 [Halalkalibacter wakoensis JCM 9140]|uniref:HEAT repeat domain-containing protein n=1 Tax=Halalkalibacter wakoensis JCM 9140 TaxID=1236970 RepID=W4Q2P8_9BACI|nr:hypothetical protein [Halalkalibacter wakoensis]GAE26262.1 hypothetical protein JCM9140_2311 [Halalkalibacter wakoensis JCM 9140]
MKKKVKNAKGKVKQIKRKLLNLGFEERAYKDLIEMLSDTKDVHLKKFAAWELALWHGNKYTKEDAKKCLEFLSVVIKEETDSSTIRKAKILVAECQEILGQNIIAKKELERLLTEETHPDLLIGKGK